MGSYSGCHFVSLGSDCFFLIVRDIAVHGVKIPLALQMNVWGGSLDRVWVVVVFQLRNLYSEFLGNGGLFSRYRRCFVGSGPNCLFDTSLDYHMITRSLSLS